MATADGNRLILCGTAAGAPAFSHAAHGTAFFCVPLIVPRRSGTADRLPVIVPERRLPPGLMEGGRLRVQGQLRAYRWFDETGRHLRLFAYAKEAALAAPDDGAQNEVQLSGTVCRPPVYRVTPLGREIADVLLCCEQPFGRRDFLPVILWSALARSAAAWPAGQRVRLAGRFQSRPYDKALPDGAVERRTAYEVSAASACVLN